MTNCTSKYPTTAALIAFAVSLTLLTTQPTAAQLLVHDDLEQLFNEPVTTSVTGSPQRASQVPAAMTIITAEDIRRSGARDLPGVLRHVAGIDVLQWTNDHADVAVRGYNQSFSPRLLVLVDGRQVYADYYGFTPWTTIPVELNAIYQIEIVKGPAGALFGFNAASGVINIVTQDLSHDHDNFVSVTAGTQDLLQGSAVTTLHLGDRAAVRLTGGMRRNDDFSTPLRSFEEGIRRGNERNAATIDARWRVTDKVQVRFEGTYGHAAQAEVPPSYTMSYGDYDTYSAKLDLIADTRLALIEASIYRNWIDTDAFLPRSVSPDLNFVNEVTVAQVRGIFKPGAAHTFRLSGEYRHNTMETTPVTGAEVYYDVFSGAGMWQWVIRPDLTLTGALRVDHLKLGRSGYLPSAAVLSGITDASWDRSITRLNFNAGVLWQTSDLDTLRVNAGRGQLLPNLLNLGGNIYEFPGFTYVGNPLLNPSEVSNYEFGWERQFPEIAGRLRVAGFYGRTSDIITFFLGNLGVSRTIGVELALSGVAGEHWRWGVSYTPQQVRDRFPDSYAVSFGLVDYEHTTPLHVVNANLGWARERWEIDAYLRYQSTFSAIDGTATNGLREIGDHLVLDARTAYRINKYVTVAVTGQDLTGSRQRQTSGPLIERRVFATMTLAF